MDNLENNLQLFEAAGEERALTSAEKEQIVAAVVEQLRQSSIDLRSVAVAEDLSDVETIVGMLPSGDLSRVSAEMLAKAGGAIVSASIVTDSATTLPVLSVTWIDGSKKTYPFPVAAAPTEGEGLAVSFPGQAGVVSAEDFGRFDRGAEYADIMLDRLKERKVVEELEATATAEGVKLVQHRWRPDGGRDISLADADGDVAAQSDDAGVAPQAGTGGGNAVEGGVEINQHPHDITLALPVASTEQAGVMTASQVAKLESAGEAGFRELWTSAYGCTVDDAAPASQRYVCNWLGMSLAEAKQTYAAGQLGCQLGGSSQYRGLQIRTNIPPYPYSHSGQYSLHQAFANNGKLEIAAATYTGQAAKPSSWDGTFAFCGRLHTVIGPVDKPVANTFYKCDRLENVTFALDANCKSFSLVDCPLISLASMQTIPAGSAKRTASISVTVHADVYAKLTDPEGHPEWVQVVLDAADKNIIFTTA